MDREIKFKAYIKSKNVIRYVKAIHFWEFIITEEKKPKKYSIDDVDLMQFTGFKDCYWNDIYESDIVKSVKNDDDWIHIYYDEVSYDEDWFLNFDPGWTQFIYLRELLTCDKYEIAGEPSIEEKRLWQLKKMWNVYKNPAILLRNKNKTFYR